MLVQCKFEKLYFLKKYSNVDFNRNVDSGWSTGYNDFFFDPKKYLKIDLKKKKEIDFFLSLFRFWNASEMIQQVHALNSRIIFWTTAMVNVDSPNYKYGLDNKFYLNDGYQINWWKGTGSFIDYTNPKALDWWHSMLDNVLNLGADGI